LAQPPGQRALSADARLSADQLRVKLFDISFREGAQPALGGMTFAPLDPTWLSWIGLFLNILISNRSTDEPLWPFSHEELISSLKRASATLGLEHMKICLGDLRHGGASHDSLHDLRTLMEIKTRGRGASDRSLRRYREETRARAELLRLLEDVRTFGQATSNQLDGIFLDPLIARRLLPLVHARPT
jgi:hypothetical protein